MDENGLIGKNEQTWTFWHIREGFDETKGGDL